MRRSLPVVFLASALAGACSTAEPLGIQQECFSDEDCQEGEVCVLEQGGVCINLSVPARRQVLGMRVSDGSDSSTFRIEFRGCDAEIDPIDGVLRTDKRSSLSTINLIKPVDAVPSMDCAECPDDCIDGTACRAQFTGNISIVQDSRLDLGALRIGPLAFPEMDPDEGTPIDEPVSIEWPRYILTDEAVDTPVIVELDPEDASLAKVLRELAPPEASGEREFEVINDMSCQRRVRGNVRRFGTQNLISDAAVDFFFNEPVATPALTLGANDDQLTPCESDEDCSEGHACSLLSDRCVLDLTGYRASRTATSVDGVVTVPVYTYCEDALVSERDFTVDLSPPSGSGLPRMRYEVAQTFNFVPFGTITNDILEGGDLCLPNWAAPNEVSLSYSGEPVKLLDQGGEYVCCSIDCLPTTLDDKPPTTATECSDIPLTMSVHASVTDIDAQEWTDNGCLVPLSEGGGTYTAQSSCDGTSGTCSVLASSGVVDGEGLSYEIRLISPEDSVFASQTLTATLTEGELSFPDVELSPRVVLSGQVLCDPELGDGCSVADVAIIVERLRVEGESPPPQYLFDTLTRADGRFTLPIDPGIYVMTAVPQRGFGNQAGPANYQVIDARLGEDNEVQVNGGAPRLDIGSSGLELKEGIPVVVRLRDFAPGGRLAPVDIGSWQYQDPKPALPGGEALDLNDPQTCHTDGGCVVRNMLPPNTGDLLASISNSIDFTMRTLGPVSCP